MSQPVIAYVDENIIYRHMSYLFKNWLASKSKL